MSGALRHVATVHDECDALSAGKLPLLAGGRHPGQSESRRKLSRGAVLGTGLAGVVALVAGTLDLRATSTPSKGLGYERRRPETGTLYQVVRDNLQTLYAAVDDGFAAPLPAFVRNEFERYLDCGILCRGFAWLQCDTWHEQRLVAFSCKGRGFCGSCLGRRMAQSAANLVDHVLPMVSLRQFVITFPFELRARPSDRQTGVRKKKKIA